MGAGGNRSGGNGDDGTRSGERVSVSVTSCVFGCAYVWWRGCIPCSTGDLPVCVYACFFCFAMGYDVNWVTRIFSYGPESSS